MIFSCSHCKTQFNIPEEKIPEKGARVRCVKCKKTFKVERKNKNNKNNAPVAGKKQGTDTRKQEPDTRKTVIKKETPPSKRTSPPASSGKKQKQEQEAKIEPQIQVKKKRGGSTQKKGAPTWIVTFADLATLMLTFFVLLLSFANMDIAKFKDMLGSVQDAFGVTKKTKGKFQSTLKGKEGVEKAKPGSGTAEEKAKEEHDRQEIAKEIEQTAKSIQQSKNISVQVGAHGVHVRIKGAYFFEPGSANLKKASFPFLNKISNLMHEFPFKLIVEGHTDNISISTQKFPSNWELSAVRATTVLRYFTEKHNIDPGRLTAIGYADNKPLASNDDVVGRAKNRRVEFIFSK